MVYTTYHNHDTINKKNICSKINKKGILIYVKKNFHHTRRNLERDDKDSEFTLFGYLPR